MALKSEVTSVVARNAVRTDWAAEIVEDVVRTAVDGGREDERKAPEEPPVFETGASSVLLGTGTSRPTIRVHYRAWHCSWLTDIPLATVDSPRCAPQPAHTTAEPSIGIR